MKKQTNKGIIHSSSLFFSGIIKQFNVLDDLQNDAGEEKTSRNVVLAVPNSSEDQVVLRDVETLNFITQFEICRIIFFARGNSG